MKRRRPIVNVTISPEAIARLDEMAIRSGQSRSAAIERLIRQAPMPRSHAASKESVHAAPMWHPTCGRGSKMRAPQKLGQNITLHHADCLVVMSSMKNESVDLIATDPPYEILDMRIAFAEMARLLKPSGSIYIFGDKDVVAEHWYREVPIANKTLLVWHYTNSPQAPRPLARLDASDHLRVQVTESVSIS
jgi:hypothetical protein